MVPRVMNFLPRVETSHILTPFTGACGKAAKNNPFCKHHALLIIYDVVILSAPSAILLFALPFIFVILRKEPRRSITCECEKVRHFLRSWFRAGRPEYCGQGP